MIAVEINTTDGNNLDFTDDRNESDLIAEVNSMDNLLIKFYLLDGSSTYVSKLQIVDINIREIARKD